MRVHSNCKSADPRALITYLRPRDWVTNVDSRPSWHSAAFGVDAVGDGAVVGTEHWANLNGVAGPEVTAVPFSL